MLKQGQNIVFKTGKVTETLYFEPRTKISSDKLYATGAELVNAPHQLRMVMRLLEEQNTIILKPVLDSVAAIGEAIYNVIDGLSGEYIKESLLTIIDRLGDMTQDLSGVQDRLISIEDGFASQEEIATLEQINTGIGQLENSVQTLQHLTQHVLSHNFDPYDNTDQLLVLLNETLTGITSILSEFITIDSRLNTINNNAVRVYYEQAIVNYQDKVTTLIGQLQELAALQQSAHQVNQILSLLVDLSGISSQNIVETFTNIEGFELNLLHGILGKIVIFGDQNLDGGRIDNTGLPQNGKKWTEYLATRLNVISQLESNFAIATASSSDNSFTTGKYVDLPLQIQNMFLAQYPVKRNDIYVIQVGTNDLLFHDTNPQTICNNVRASILTLFNNDVRFVILADMFWRAEEDDGTNRPKEVATKFKAMCSQLTDSNHTVLYWDFDPETDSSGFGTGYDLNEPYPRYRTGLSPEEWSSLDTYLWDSQGNATTLVHSRAADKVFKAMMDHREQIKSSIKSNSYF